MRRKKVREDRPTPVLRAAGHSISLVSRLTHHGVQPNLGRVWWLPATPKRKLLQRLDYTLPFCFQADR